jgi:hypothetical protein
MLPTSSQAFLPHKAVLPGPQFGAFNEKQERRLSTLLDYMDTNNPDHRFKVRSEDGVILADGTVVFHPNQDFWVRGLASNESLPKDHKEAFNQVEESQISRLVKLQPIAKSGHPEKKSLYLLETALVGLFNPISALKPHAQKIGAELAE